MDDDVFNPDQTFEVILTDPVVASGAIPVKLGNARAAWTIIDDDLPGSLGFQVPFLLVFRRCGVGRSLCCGPSKVVFLET